MSWPDPREYLEKHLYNELRYLLCAATEWHVQEIINPDDKLKGQHIKVYAMDSAALHARALFEFLTSHTVRNDLGVNHFGVDYFGVKKIKSELYGHRESLPALGCWSSPLHAFLMHLQDRSVTQELTGFDGKTLKDLKKMPVDFAQEVVRLWRVFIDKLREANNPLAELAERKLNHAIASSALVLTHGIPPIPPIPPIKW
jgi:hypothetical protein